MKREIFRRYDIEPDCYSRIKEIMNKQRNRRF